MTKLLLIIPAILIFAFILWLGRPYEFSDYPACDNPNFSKRDTNINGKLVNCGPQLPFLYRVRGNWIDFAIQGTPIIANLHLSHNKNCNKTAIYGNGNFYIKVTNNTIDNSKGDLCLYLEPNK